LVVEVGSPKKERGDGGGTELYSSTTSTVLPIDFDRPQLPAPPNQLTAHNIKVSSFVTIGKFD
jgi:hypothetical protein